jgi:hypothetical protein
MRLRSAAVLVIYYRYISNFCVTVFNFAHFLLLVVALQSFIARREPLKIS